jgi:hypothetical protein
MSCPTGKCRRPLDNLPPVTKGLAVVGRANCMGLGSMTEDFCREMRPELIIIIDPENGMKIDTSRIAGNVVVVRSKDWARLSTLPANLLCNMRVVVGFETFYSDLFMSYCVGLGVKTLLFPMWECSPNYVSMVDLLVCLSSKDDEHYSERPFKNMVRCQWPASPMPSVVQQSRNWPPKIFTHIAGNANHNRNGTREVLRAATYLRGTGAKLAVYSNFDFPLSWSAFQTGNSPIERRGHARERADLFIDADCLVHPQQIPGLSLPINEAAGCGIPVICLSIDDWYGWPYSLPAHRAGTTHFARGVTEVLAPDIDQLGQLMADMATGNVDRVVPPQPPTWADFRKQWSVWMEDLKIEMICC